MKKIVHIFLCVLLITLFSACTDGREQVEEYRADFTSRQEVRYRAKMRLHLDDLVRDYTLLVTHTDDQTALSVLEPEAMAGLGAVVAGEKMTLTYDDVVFAGERVKGGLPSPLLCFPLYWEAMKSGNLILVDETREGVVAELICYYEESEYTIRILFDGESQLPRKIQVLHDGTTQAEIGVQTYEEPPGVTFES